MRIENEEERKFYEFESISNSCSLRELQRQFDSALYERLVLSRDKEKELSAKGQIRSLMRKPPTAQGFKRPTPLGEGLERTLKYEFIHPQLDSIAFVSE
jgi:predicted nuclease of restriction endonuclease-like (RecB) superfamily